jgi:membrane-anchored glycerophosphoryl diester phosphodiesterase (GDPDase)
MENPREKTPSAVDERDLILSMRKLDVIKELGFVILHFFELIYLLFSFSREKQNQLQTIQTHLNQNTDLMTRENQVLREFRKELDLLIQERMSHIEELRLIHADINIVCLQKMRFFIQIIFFVDGNND